MAAHPNFLKNIIFLLLIFYLLASGIVQVPPDLTHIKSDGKSTPCVYVRHFFAKFLIGDPSFIAMLILTFLFK